MSILSRTKTGKCHFRDQVQTWLKETLKLQEGEYTLNEIRAPKGGPLYEINMNGRDVNLMDYKISELPDYIQFGEIIGGNFICSYSKLTSTKGFPRTVGLTFDCSFSQIKSLDGMPELVDRDFIWLNSSFTDEEIRDKVRVTCRVFR